MELLLDWLVLTIAVLLAGAVLPGVQVRGFWGAALASALLGLLHFFIGWILFVAIGLATLGLGFLLAFLTRWIVTALLLKLTDAFTDKIRIDGFGNAVLAAMIMSGVGTLAQWLLH